MSQHRTSSLAALGHADVDEKERSSGVGSSSADVPNAVSAGYPKHVTSGK